MKPLKVYPSSKVCTRCKLELPIERFTLYKRQGRTLREYRKAHCRGCGSKLARNWVLLNKEMSKKYWTDYVRNRRDLDPEYAQRLREYQRKYVARKRAKDKSI